MIIIEYSYLSSIRKTFRSEADTIIIGRPSEGQEVTLDLSPDMTVSRHHARLTFEDRAYWLEDLNSRSGVLVNDKKIAAKTKLAPGDRITMGQTYLVVRQIQTLPPPPQESDALVTQPVNFDEEGVLTSSVRATELPSTLLLAQEADASSDITRRRLTAFYELGTALSTVETVEPLLKTVVERLCNAIPGAQRGALLLKHGNELTLQACIPEKARPSVSLHLAQLAIEKQEAFTWRRDTPGQAGNLTDSIIWHGTQCAMYVPLIWQEEVLGIVYVDNFVAEDAFSVDDLRLLMAMASQAAMFVKNHALQEELRHQEVVRSNLLRQFSPRVAGHLENLLQEHGDLALGGERVEPVTILSADVRGFTALSAEMDPKDVMDMLNQLFGACIPIIFKYNGTVDKYIGDGLLAVFGSPDPDPKGRQWESAVKAALDMQRVIYRLGKKWQSMGLPVYQIGIGIHTGAVLQGFIGSREQMEYTVIGDTVNRASRYCDGADKGEVVISQAVYKHVAGLVDVTPKTIKSRHPDTEADLEAYVVKGFGTRALEPALM
ncbi:MAG: FHA domain-containing protein [Anaerolineae bacterium]|nr:FHA domain-containing protein [Anaerolineae bacterium]